MGIITHDADVLVHSSQLFGNQVLGNVGVLKLVYHHVFEALLVLVEHFEVVTKKDVGVEEQVVKVHGPGLEKALLVALVDLPHSWAEGSLVIGLHKGVVLVGLPGDQSIFCP